MGVTLLGLLNVPPKRSGDLELSMDASLAPAGLSVLQEEKGHGGWGHEAGWPSGSREESTHSRLFLAAGSAWKHRFARTARANCRTGRYQPGSPYSPLLALPRAELAVPAPLAAVGALFPPSCEAGRSQGGMWLPEAPPDPVSLHPPSPHLPEPSCLVSCRDPYQLNSTSLR